MPDDIEFGDDDGPDDQWDASGAAPDPEAFTIRFHEERVNRDLTDLPYWHALDDDDREISRLIGYAVLDQIIAGRDADDISDYLDDLRSYLQGHRIRRKDRRKDRAVIEALILNLRREGTLV